MGYFEDYRYGLTESEEEEQRAMEEAGFDPSCADDREMFRVEHGKVFRYCSDAGPYLFYCHVRDWKGEL